MTETVKSSITTVIPFLTILTVNGSGNGPVKQNDTCA